MVRWISEMAWGVGGWQVPPLLFRQGQLTSAKWLQKMGPFLKLRWDFGCFFLESNQKVIFIYHLLYEVWSTFSALLPNKGLTSPDEQVPSHIFPSVQWSVWGVRGTAGCLPDTQQLTVARCQVFHLTPQQKAPVGEFHVLQILTRFATSATISTAQWQLPSIVNRDCKQIKNPKPFLFLKLIICKYCYSLNPSNLYFWFGSFPTKKG